MAQLLIAAAFCMGKWLVRARLRAASFLLPLLLLEAGVGCATHRETSTLQQQEIADLKGTVERLNARIEHLEGQSSSPSASSSQPAAAPPMPAAVAPPAAEPAATLRERWRTITYGMTCEQVDALLGRPQGTIDESPKTVWYYSYPDIGNGSVVFIQESGVTDWQAPPFGNWIWWP
jgi:hypothetical protein